MCMRNARIITVISFIASLLLLCISLSAHAFNTSIFRRKRAKVKVEYKIPYIHLPIDTTSITLASVIYPFPHPKQKDIKPRKFKINANFTARERAHVGAKDVALFKGLEQFILNLALYDSMDFTFPLKGAKLLSAYKPRRRPHHSGLDLKTYANDTIIAAFDGVVRLAKPYAAYGNVIVIRHNNALETVYSHNSKHLVKAGAFVKAGTPIALTGRTGRATTEHLHFEIRVNGNHFNPEIFIDLETRKLKKKSIIFTQRRNGTFMITPMANYPKVL